MARPVFDPKKTPKVQRHIRLDLSAAEYSEIQTLAKRRRISLKEFTKQAVFFAIEHLGEAND